MRSIPIKFKNTIKRVKNDSCSLQIESVSDIAEQSFVTAWTETVKADCKLSLGERLTITPSYSQQTWVVPRTSIVNWEESNQIFVKDNQHLNMVEVEIHGEKNGEYFISTKYPLQDKQILTTSVSAVKGVLQGLGGE